MKKKDESATGKHQTKKYTQNALGLSGHHEKLNNQHRHMKEVKDVPSWRPQPLVHIMTTHYYWSGKFQLSYNQTHIFCKEIECN